MTLQNLNEHKDLVVGIFDLFRLKYINDNFGHNLGDKYIKDTAKILAKYWPKQNVTINQDGTESFQETGHCVYRIGGDEFVLLTTKESVKLTEIKAGLAALEASNIELFKDLNVPIGINFGIVEHNPDDAYKITLQKADDIMQADKTKTYQKYGIDRRR
jgi:diguanylate cyclase (GGDEF)-like protein